MEDYEMFAEMGEQYRVTKGLTEEDMHRAMDWLDILQDALEGKSPWPTDEETEEFARDNRKIALAAAYLVRLVYGDQLGGGRCSSG